MGRVMTNIDVSSLIDGQLWAIGKTKTATYLIDEPIKFKQLAEEWAEPIEVYLVQAEKVADFKPAQIDYRAYIQSPEWKIKATDAKERAGWRCQICNHHKGDVVLDAHHRTYERLGNERPEDITVLCRNCHSLYEGAKNGSG